MKIFSVIVALGLTIVNSTAQGTIEFVSENTTSYYVVESLETSRNHGVAVIRFKITDSGDILIGPVFVSDRITRNSTSIMTSIHPIMNEAREKSLGPTETAKYYSMLDYLSWVTLEDINSLNSLTLGSEFRTSFIFLETETTIIPEPSTITLGALGVCSLLFYKRWGKR